ncbi:winged helix-turn-helix transcriptional regulator [Candidatus Woesearchaeota archaeon]|nr:winged helix-turn-helix transcriptional regulator [Candidatus Woesearchaeota archaeon]
MSINLDLYDRKILFELDKDARISTTRLAKKLRRSKQFVDYRIKKLEQEEIIKGYTTVIDYSKLGYNSIRVYFKFHNITPEKQKQIEEDLIKDKEVWWLVTVEGPWDVAYAMAVKDVLEFYDYWDRLMKKYRRFISKNSVVLYTHIKQYPKAYLIGKENNYEGTLVGASKEKVECNDLDLKLLKLISDKAKMPLLEIAKKINKSPQVIRNHKKRLENKGVIQGYRALIDVSFLGYRYYKSYINLLNTDQIAGLELFCALHPNILNMNRTIGGRDFEIELQVKSFDEFEQIMNDIREKFAGMIDEYEFVIAREEKKMTYFPFE